jgi:hypothetical protein
VTTTVAGLSEDTGRDRVRRRQVPMPSATRLVENLREFVERPSSTTPSRAKLSEDAFDANPFGEQPAARL